jgi:hypothetical protein
MLTQASIIDQKGPNVLAGSMSAFADKADAVVWLHETGDPSAG